MSQVLIVARQAWEDMLQHAREASPEECCGLLLGSPRRVQAVARARNVALEPRRRFLVDPADHFQALRRARAAGLEIVGAYHSHPEGVARPSETDRAEAIDDERFVQIIVAPRTSAIAAYSFVEGTVVALPIVAG